MSKPSFVFFGWSSEKPSTSLSLGTSMPLITTPLYVTLTGCPGSTTTATSKASRFLQSSDDFVWATSVLFCGAVWDGANTLHPAWIKAKNRDKHRINFQHSFLRGPADRRRPFEVRGGRGLSRPCRRCSLRGPLRRGWRRRGRSR